MATTNRERSTVADFVGSIPQNEAIDDVVESGAGIEKEIADDSGEKIRRFRQANPKKQYIALRVFIGNELAIAVSKLPKDSGYRIEMFICPDEFEVGAPQRGFCEGFQARDISTFG